MLVFAPFGKDAALIEKVLQRSAVSDSDISDLKELEAAINEDAGAAIITEEVLQNGAIAALAHRARRTATLVGFPDHCFTGSGL